MIGRLQRIEGQWTVVEGSAVGTIVDHLHPRLALEAKRRNIQQRNDIDEAEKVRLIGVAERTFMMVEQVARAIEEQRAGCDPRNSSAFVDAARAAIAAMREPSREMLSAAQGWSYRLIRQVHWRRSGEGMPARDDRRGAGR